MLKAVEDISPTKKRLKIEVPVEPVEREIRISLENVRREATIPGFRHGKAPMSIIEKKFGKRVEADILEKILPKAYVEALKEANVSPIGNPVLEEKFDFKRNQPIEMTFIVDVMPDIDNLQYENLEIKDIPLVVKDSEITDILKRLRDGKATYEPSENPVEMGDLIVIDYSSTGGDIEAKDCALKVGEDTFPPEFLQKLLGKNKGDEPLIDTAFPADYKDDRLAGRNVMLKVVIRDIKKKIVPDLDDEFAKDMGFESLDALNKNIRADVLKSRKAEAEKAQKAEIMRKIVEKHIFEVPESLVENEIEMLASNAMVIASTSAPDKEGEKDIDALRPELRADAVRNVKASILIELIGRKEKVSVTDDEVKSAITDMAKNYSMQPESLMKFYLSRDGSLDRLRSTIFKDKVLDLLLAKNVLTKGE